MKVFKNSKLYLYNYFFTVISVLLLSLNLYAESPDYGDTIETAETLDLSSYKYGTIDPKDDVDFFKIEVNEKQYYTIETSLQPGQDEMDTVLYIYNSDGELVENDDDNGVNEFSRIVIELTSGIYYIKVNSYKNDSTGNYRISFNEYKNYTDNNPRDFTLQKQDNIKGNITMIGNSVLQSYDGTCLDSTTQNNDIYAYYADKDNDSDTYNSTSADLVLPAGIKSENIVYALLYWQGRTVSNTYAATYGRDVKLKLFNMTNYDIITSENDKFNYIDGDYQGVADITEQLKSSIDSLDVDTLSNEGYNKPVWVADIYTEEGENRYGAWSLIVTYKDENAKLKNITLYDGYDEIYNNSKSYTLSNFLTPTRGDINAKFLVFAGEGDVVYPDSISLTDKDGNEISLGDDFFHSSEDIDGVNITNRNPNCQNTIGIDLRTISVGTNASIPIIGNEQTQTTVKLSSSGDQYFPGVFAFSTELYEPRVCYYIDKITDEENQIVYENKEFVSDIVQNKKYKVSLWIANMKKDPADTNIETAKKVKIDVDYNDFDYFSESTYIMNIGDNNYSHITDIIDSDIGEFLNDYNKSVWRVGDGANDSDGGTILPTLDFNSNSYKVFVDFNGTFIIDNNTTEINLDDIFTIKASYATDYLEITDPVTIPKCQDFSTVASTYIPNIGSFNVVESSFESATDPTDINSSLNAINTKIANKEETLKALSLDSDFETLKNLSSMVEIDLIQNPLFSENECQNNPTLNKQFITFSNDSSKNFTFKYNKALKDGRFRIKYLTDESGSIIEYNACTDKTFNCVWGLLTQIATDRYGNDCPTGTTFVNDDNTYCDVKCAVECNYYRERNQGDDQVPPDECLECLFGNYSQSVCSRDNFAIRPDRFNITNIPANIKAGKDFNITIQALDFNNQPALDYNKTLSLTTLVSPKLDFNDTKNSSGCINGNLTNNGSLQFKNGEANVTLKYDEIGDLNITIKEILGSEFAQVDTKDTTETNRFISQGSKVISIIPDHFSLNASFKDFNSSFTYLSADINSSMAATIDINITAKNAQNITTKNYKNGCYAKNSDYNITFSPLHITGLTNLIYQETNSSSTGTTLMTNNSFQISNVSKNIFKADENGTANVKIKINFDRNDSIAVNPFIFNIQDINMSDENNITGSINLDKNATFYYGRAHAPDQRIDGSTGNAHVYYEVYCKDCNKTLYNINGKESIDSINWYQNPLHTSVAFGTYFETLPTSADGTIIGTTNLNDMQVTAPKVPHRDKITLKPNSWLKYSPTDFLVEFYKAGTKWAGQGKLGTIVDVNVSKRSNRRIDW